MKRLLITGAVGLALLTGAGSAQAAAPTPAPGPQASTAPQPTPSSTRSVDPQTEEDCRKTHTTVTDGISDFAAQLEDADTAASGGDLAAAEKAVKSAGTELVNLSSDLKKDVEGVENAELATALTDVANELNNLGGSLTTLTSLQTFDTARLQALSMRVGEICAG
jgi:hypothetical protein